MQNEKAVLGACFLADGVDEALSILTPDDFGDERHRAIFDAISAVAGSGGVPDMVTVTSELRGRGYTEMSGYVAECGGLFLAARQNGLHPVLLLPLSFR